MAFDFLRQTCRSLALGVGFIGLVLVLTSCHTEEMRDEIAEKLAVSEQKVVEGRVPSPPRRYNPLTVTDSIWGGERAVRMRHGRPVPQRVEGSKSVALVATSPMSLRSIATAISTQTGIPVRLDKDAEDVAGEDDDAPPTSATIGSSSLSTPLSTAGGAAAARTTAAGAPRPNATAARSGGSSRNVMSGMRIAYEGPLSGLLEKATSHFGVIWKYDGASILLSKFETRVFVMQVMPGTQKVSDGMKEGSEAAPSATGGAQTTTISQQSAQQSSSMDIDFKFWDEVGKTLDVLLGGVGSYSLAPSSGTITVVTTPEVMRNVSDFINQENDRLGRQVAVNVEVYTVDMTEGEDFNTQFNTALRRLTNFGLNFTSPSAPAQITNGTLGALSMAILNPETVGEVTDVFNLLSQVGKTARVAQFPMTTLNNRPVSRRVGQDRTYLASVQTNTSQSFQNTTLTPGIIRDGFSIQVTPRILQDGNILLQYSLSLIDILEISNFESGGNSVQLPRTASRIFVQQSMLKSGSTLILAGYDQDQAQQSSQGIGNAYNYVLGGGVGNQRQRQILFLAMTPQEISLPRTEND
jgi:type IVB pilus formation R64 PilN family outer membrane protein